MSRLHRWLYALRTLRNYADLLNRRVEVQATLLAVGAGKRPLLTREECWALAAKLEGRK